MASTILRPSAALKVTPKLLSSVSVATTPVASEFKLIAAATAARVVSMLSLELNVIEIAVPLIVITAAPLVAVVIEVPAAVVVPTTATTLVSEVLRLIAATLAIALPDLEALDKVSSVESVAPIV